MALKKVLNEWGNFLAVCLPFLYSYIHALTKQSSNSSYVLNEDDNGWFGPTGKRYLEQAGNSPHNTSLSLCELYKCDPSFDHYGFSSWDGRLSVPGKNFTTLKYISQTFLRASFSITLGLSPTPMTMTLLCPPAKLLHQTCRAM